MDIPRSLITFVLGFICLTNAAQTTIYSCNGLYRIELPAKLELQASELNSVKRIGEQGKKLQVNITTQSGHITFQQKGLNDDVKEAYNRYCRVIVEYFKEDRNEPVYGQGDQILVDRELLNTVHNSVREACSINKIPLMNFITIQQLSINGFPVLYYSYRRKGWEGKQPPVIVNVYTIFNKYESVILTFSYREAEREMWKSIHNNIIKTFSFTKIY